MTAEQHHYRRLEAGQRDWDRRNPDACPDCKGRPGELDYLSEGGGEHAPCCKEVWWAQHGYYKGRHLEGDMWVVLINMLYSHRLALCTELGILDYYCYPKELGLEHAIQAWEQWNGKSDPLRGWVKASNERRPEGGDMLNP